MTTQADRPAKAAPARRAAGITLWHAKDARPFGEMSTGMQYPPEIKEQFEVGRHWAEGATAKILYREPAPDGCSIVYVWFGPNVNVHRHHHSSDCAYLVVAGQAILGRQVLNP